MRTRARTATRAGEPRSVSGRGEERVSDPVVSTRRVSRPSDARRATATARASRPKDYLRARHRHDERRSCCRAEQGGSAPRDDRGAFVPLGVQRPTGARGGAERSAMGAARVPSPEALTHRRVQLRDPGRDGGCVRGVRPGHRQAREHVRAHGGVLRARQRPCGRGHGRGHKRGNHHHEYVNAPPPGPPEVFAAIFLFASGALSKRTLCDWTFTVRGSRFANAQSGFRGIFRRVVNCFVSLLPSVSSVSSAEAPR